MATRFSASSSRLALAPSRLAPRSRQAVRRHLHARRELPYKVEDGLGNFMSPRTLQTVAVEYQQGLLDRLNEHLHDAEDQRKTIAQLVLDTAERPDRTLPFRYASHALNNSFFLHCLRPPTGETGEDAVERSPLGPTVRKQFGTLDTLRAQFAAAVQGMAGSGYAWLVADARRNLAFVPTFAAGTLLVRSRRGTVDPLAVPVLGEGRDVPLPNPHAQNTTTPSPSPPSSASPASGSGDLPPHHSPSLSSNIFSTRTRSVYDPAMPSQLPGPMGDPDMRNPKTLGEYIYPLFCVSVHEHCWLIDHGVWGKERYMKELWSVLDWAQVVHRFETFNPTT